MDAESAESVGELFGKGSDPEARVAFLE